MPLGRRLRAARGKIIMSLVWATAASTCAVMLLLQHGVDTRAGIAVAVTRAVPVRAPESGRLATLVVVPNQHVEAGDALATIEVPGLSQRVAAAEADLRLLEAKLSAEELDRGRKFARDLEDSRASWLQARVALERERAEFTGVEQDLARSKAPGVLISAGEVDRLTVRRDAASAAVEARAAEVTALERNYQEARSRAGGLESELLTTSVETAAVRLESLRVVQDANVLRAPVAGVVSAPISVQARDGRTSAIDESYPVTGQWIQAGIPLLTVTEPATQEAIVFVDLTRARQLTPGAPVSVRGDSGQAIEATVQSIGAAVEPVPLRQLRDQMQAEWGVPVTLRVSTQTFTPGEALSVEF